MEDGATLIEKRKEGAYGEMRATPAHLLNMSLFQI
jgi:hypothetical protein